MKRAILAVMLLGSMNMLGCTGDKGKELFDTAQLEEKQHNLPHATQLYEELVKKHPGSALAKKAEERLALLKSGMGAQQAK